MKLAKYWFRIVTAENPISVGGDRASAPPECRKWWRKPRTLPVRSEASPEGLWRWKHNPSHLGFGTSVLCAGAAASEVVKSIADGWRQGNERLCQFISSVFYYRFQVETLWKKIFSLQMPCCVCRGGGLVILGCCCAVISGPRIKNLIILRKSFSFRLRRLSTAVRAKFQDRFHPSG